eukprot:6480997-Amphidinium_carterae.1
MRANIYLGSSREKDHINQEKCHSNNQQSWHFDNNCFCRAMVLSLVQVLKDCLKRKFKCDLKDYTRLLCEVLGPAARRPRVDAKTVSSADI